MGKITVLLVFTAALVMTMQNQVLAKSCEERCDDAKDRCESHASSIAGGFADSMNCVAVQQRCAQEENAKAFRGGFADHARCMQLGNECTNRATDNMKNKMSNTSEQCDEKYEVCMDRCNR